MRLENEFKKLMKKEPIDIFLQLTDEELRIGYRKKDLKVTAFKLFTEIPEKKLEQQVLSILNVKSVDEIKADKFSTHTVKLGNKDYVVRVVHSKTKNGLAETNTWILNILMEAV